MTTQGGAATIQQTQIFIDARSFAGEPTQFANLIAEDIQRAGLGMPVALPSPPDTVSSEDPVNNVLDRQINALRDMLRDGKPNTAMTGLQVLLSTLPGVASPRILFRIKANIGHCLHRLGRFDEAADCLFEACEHTPHEKTVPANKAMAYLLKAQPQEAYDYACAELRRHPDDELLASYLIQAASRLSAIADPLAHIPIGLRDRTDVMVAILVFYRNRGDQAEWLRRARAAHRRYPNDVPTALLAAQAEIQDYLDRRAFVTTYRVTQRDREVVTAAAERLQARWDERQHGETAKAEDEISFAVSAMIGWQIIRQPNKACAIAKQFIKLGITNRQAMINAAQILADSDNDELSQRAFALVPESPEACWARGIAAVQRDDWMTAASILRDGEVPAEERDAARTFVALAPIVHSDNATDEATLRDLIGLSGADIRAIIAVAQIARRRGFGEVAAEAFATALRSITYNAPKEARFIAAHYARSNKDPSTVIDLLNDIVPHDQPSAALLYLAEAHAVERPRKLRNKTFFDQLHQSIKRMPAYACEYADYLLNIGEVDHAITVLKRLQEEEPKVSAHVLRLSNAYQRKPDVDAFMALARGIDLTELEMSPLARANIALMLREAGRIDGALQQGLAAVRAAPNNPAVASAYIGLLIGNDPKVVLAPVTHAAEDTYVRLTGPHGEARSFIIDRGGAFWGIDSYPPDHAFANRLLGKAVGDVIVQPKLAGPEETWTIVELKNKYLHVLHFIMEDFEQRFAGYEAITRISIEGEDIAPILDFVRQRAEANREFARHYTDQHMPLEFVARMMGGDVLSFAGYVAGLGEHIFTCVGSQEERAASIALAKAQVGRGVVLDSYTALTAAALRLLPTLKAHFGDLGLSSTTISLIDRMMARQNERLGRESMTIAWHNGEYLRETHNDASVEQNKVLLAAWKTDLLAHTTVRTDFFPDEVSPQTASLAAKLGPDPFLPIYQAAERHVVFLSDDAPTRTLAAELTGVQTIWLQPVLLAAKEAGHLSVEACASALAGLAARNHWHTSVTASDLIGLFHNDTDGALREFRQLAFSLGGPSAEFFSHVNVVAETVLFVFHPTDVKGQAATGILLENLIKGRPDYAALLGYLAAHLISHKRFQEYLQGWIGGHFLPLQDVVSYGRNFDTYLRSIPPLPITSRLLHRLRQSASFKAAA